MLLLVIFIGLIATDLGAVVLEAKTLGFGDLISSFVRLVLTGLLMYAIWIGQRWARLLTVALLLGWSVFLAMTAASRPHPLIFLALGVSALSGGLIGFSRNVSSFLAFQKQTLQPRRIHYEKKRVLKMTPEGLEYLPENGETLVIDFMVCRENFQKKYPGTEKAAKYVGFRDGTTEPPYITLFTTPPTVFEFAEKRQQRTPSGTLGTAGVDELRDLDEFLVQLTEAGWVTGDLASNQAGP
jgi:hypothetical protein